jgi:RNA polymerase sigma-70 factor (ECF subfamily)
MRSLARSLVTDAAQADDIVQQTWLEAVKRPPREPQAAGSWLASVLRNFARRSYREESRRRRREQLAARPEEVAAAPEELLDRLELQRQVAEEVTHLDEPYRSTILLRFFEGYSVKKIAHHEGVPVDTVKTRLRRALDHLRNCFDRRYGGDRRAWCAALLPLVWWESTGASAAAGAGTAVTSASGTGAGTGASVSTTGLSLGTGTIMTSKTAFAIGAVAVATLVAGWGIGRISAPTGRDDAIARHGLVPRETLEDLQGHYDRARAELQETKAQNAALAGQRDRLVAQVAALTAKPEPEPQAEEAKAATGASSLPVAFGKFSDLEAIKNADWNDLADAVAIMLEAIRDDIDRQNQGLPHNVDVRAKMQQQNRRLHGLAGGIMGEIPTHRMGNGEFTHPLIVANITAAMLQNAELPLTDRQLEDIVAIGNDYEAEYARIQETYTEETPELEKLIDELELKRAAVDLIYEGLTPEQRAIVSRPDIRHRAGVDMLSPALMTILLPQPQNMGSREEVRTKMPKTFAEKYGLEAEQVAAVSNLFEEWYRAVEPILDPVSPGVPLHIDQLITSGRAQLDLTKALFELPYLGEEARTAILGESTWLVPQVIEQPRETAAETAAE